MKTSDVDTTVFLSAVFLIGASAGGRATVAALAEVLKVPEKLVRSKARKLIKADLIDGCACGCRGDFWVKRWLGEQ